MSLFSKASSLNICKCAGSHAVSPAQVMLRWSIQKGFIPLPKASSEKRMQENLDIFGFELSEKEMATLDSLERYFVTGWDPSETDPVWLFFQAASRSMHHRKELPSFEFCRARNQQCLIRLEIFLLRCYMDCSKLSIVFAEIWICTCRMPINAARVQHWCFFYEPCL